MKEDNLEEGLIERPPVENERAIVVFCMICIFVTLALCVGAIFLINYLFDKKTWI
jgi:hypothetical protein